MTEQNPEHTPPAPRVDRISALAEGAPRVPRRAVVIGVVVAAMLALGGAALERAVSAAGLNPVATTDATTTVTTLAPPGVHASLAAFLGLTRLRPRPAPPFTLVDQSAGRVSLSSLRGRVVVITFTNASCTDACPVLAADLRRADADLGPARAAVVFLTINTDPLETASRPPPPVVTATGLRAMANWHYLTGPLATLNPVWRHYGVTIDVYPATGRVTHNDVVYFVDARGQLRLRATPVADEAPSGTFHLSAAEIRRSAAGIAHYAASLVSTRP